MDSSSDYDIVNRFIIKYKVLSRIKMQGNTNMSAEVQVIFKTTLPEEYQVPDVTININTGAGNKELTQIVK
jgi:hypothetical protein